MIFLILINRPERDGWQVSGAWTIDKDQQKRHCLPLCVGRLIELTHVPESQDEK